MVSDLNINFETSNHLCNYLLSFTNDLCLKFVDDKITDCNSYSFRVVETGCSALH